MKKNLYVILGLLSFSVSAGVVLAQSIALEAPVANLTEKWTSDSRNWTPVDSLSCWTNQAMALRCNARTGEDFTGYEARLVANSNSSSGYFVGDFSKIEAVSFDVTPKSFTYEPWFYFKAKNEVQWKISFAQAIAGRPDGEPVNVVIPLVYSTNWMCGYPSDRAAHFEADLADVATIGFFFERKPTDTASEQLAVDNLKLIGPWGGPYADGQVPVAWLMENNLATTNLSTIGGEDSDGDGRCNSAEFLAGTDPTNSASYFVVSIERDENGKMVLKWKNNRLAPVAYDILESTDLSDPNSFVTTASNIESSSVQVTTNVGQQAEGPRFYKIRIKSKN